MNPLIHLKKATPPLSPGFVLTWFALSPQARAVVRHQTVATPASSTRFGDDALISNTTGAGNTALGWRALFTNTDASFSTGVGGGALALNNGESNTALAPRHFCSTPAVRRTPPLELTRWSITMAAATTMLSAILRFLTTSTEPKRTLLATLRSWKTFTPVLTLPLVIPRYGVMTSPETRLCEPKHSSWRFGART